MMLLGAWPSTGRSASLRASSSRPCSRWASVVAGGWAAAPAAVESMRPSIASEAAVFILSFLRLGPAWPGERSPGRRASELQFGADRKAASNLIGIDVDPRVPGLLELLIPRARHVARLEFEFDLGSEQGDALSRDEIEPDARLLLDIGLLRRARGPKRSEEQTS